MWSRAIHKVIPNVSRMITNICKIKPRTQFIVKCIKELIHQDERKLLILSGRLAHLDELKKDVDSYLDWEIKEGNLDPNEITTAYYIGKMKEYELNDATEADIIFATYAMAEEGLDIPSLNTLLLVTPKTSIIQSIGRILRKQIKEGDIPPVIVDIADNFSTFSNQATQRSKYYMKQNYLIEEYKVLEEDVVTYKKYLSCKLNKSINEIHKQFPDLIDEPFETSLTDNLAIDLDKINAMVAETDCTKEEKAHPNMMFIIG